MFRSLRSSRLGRYYSSVLVKYGTIAPLVLAFAAFVAVISFDNFSVLGLVDHYSGTSFVISVVIISICAALALYFLLGKLAKREINAADLIIYVLDITAVLILIAKIFLHTSSAFNTIYIISLVVAVLLTFLRVLVATPIDRPLDKKADADATFKTYFKALISKYNPVVLVVAALAIFGLLYIFGGTKYEDEDIWLFMAVAAVALSVASVIFSLPRRLASKRMSSVDAVLYIVPLILGFSVVRLVIWLAALGLIALFEVLLVKNTHIERSVKTIETYTGNKGFGVYFRQLSSKYNLLLVGALAALGFVAVYSLLPIDPFRGVQTWAVGGMYIIIDAVIVGVAVALLLSSRRSRVGVNDSVIFALSVFALLSLIITIQYFSVTLLICWILFVALLAVLYTLRIKNVVEVKVVCAEEYNPVRLFSKDNVVTVASSVKKAFVKDKDAHYISNKESRRIAKENMRTMKEYEKAKKRKHVPESEYLTQMRDDRNIVEFENLHTYFYTDAGVVKAVNGVTFDIPQGSTVGVIGESGCGKSVTSLSLMQLVQAPKGQVQKGSEIRFKSTVYKEDENGKRIPIYEVQLDENGNEMHDENGDPIYVTAPKMRKGKPVLDKSGNPILEKVQKKDANGILLFETEEKVYNIAKMPTEVMRNIRGREISMIFQEPMTSLNPIFTIGNQLEEVVFLHIPGATKESAKARTFEMLKLVGIIPENVYKRYPHELSGGMRQRVMIAMSLLCNPKLIIADEPTTALDVTIQAQILDLLRDVKQKINGSIMFITHDLGVIAEMADYVVVMYAGRIIEMGTAKEIFDNPLHPYTMGLQKSKPAVNKKVDRLYSIPGSVPNPIDMPNYCYFRDRCDKRCAMCNGDYPEMIQVSPTHKVSCHLYAKEDINNGKQ